MLAVVLMLTFTLFVLSLIEFASFCEGLFRNIRCIPFDSNEPSPYAADAPSNLYLSSAGTLPRNLQSNLSDFSR
jgi:hypothetical protein